MARLIDADAIIDFIDMDSTWDPLETCFSERDVVDMLESAPTVDAVEIVRCKDCKYRFKNNGHGRDGCPIIDANIWMDDDDFCSHGERKEGAN